MHNGNETWKWGVVFILLAIFLVTANQAYQHVTSQEHFEPPDDYLHGDSWDLEQRGGPGSGQPVSLPSGYNPVIDQESSSQAPVETEEEIEPMILDSDIDWNNVKDPAGD